MKKIILNLFLLVAILKCIQAENSSAERNSTELSDDDYWKGFVNQFNKTYKNETIKTKRRQQYLSNLKKINQQNENYKNGKASFTYGQSIFSDLSEDEFKSFISKGFKKSSSSNRTFNIFKGDDFTSVKPEVNWLFMLPQVKNQDSCGSCWAMAASTAIEFEYSTKIGRLLTLSDQQLLDCTYPVSRDGCAGGDSVDALEYLKRVYGIEAGSSYPYIGQISKCNYKSEKVAATNVVYTQIPTGNESELIRALNNHVVIVTLNVPVEFQNIDSKMEGIYTGPCSTNISDANHNAVLVGYTSKYYILRMSWGSKWGINGAVYLPRNENKCGVANLAYYPTVVPLNNKIFNDDILTTIDNITSLNGLYIGEINIPDKNFLIRNLSNDNSAVWSTPSSKWSNTYSQNNPVQLNLTNGNLELKNRKQATLWSSNTLNLGQPGHHLELLNNGILAIFDGNTNPIFSSGGSRLQDTYITNKIFVGGYLNENEFLTSPNGKFRAILQADGNFVVYDLTYNNVSIWSSSTWRITNSSRPYQLVLQQDGNFVLKDGNGFQMWSTNTSMTGSTGHRIELQDTGILALFDGNNNPTYSSGGYIYRLNLNDDSKWVTCDSISLRCVGTWSESLATYFQLLNNQNNYYQFKMFSTNLCLYTDQQTMQLSLKTCSIDTIPDDEIFNIYLTSKSGFSLFWNDINNDVKLISFLSCDQQYECNNWLYYWYFNVITPNDPLQGAYFYQINGGVNKDLWIKCDSNSLKCTSALSESDASYFQVSLVQNSYYQFELDNKYLCLIASSNSLGLTVCSNINPNSNALFNKSLVNKNNSTLFWNGLNSNISIINQANCGTQNECAYWTTKFSIDKANIAVQFTNIIKNADIRYRIGR